VRPIDLERLQFWTRFCPFTTWRCAAYAIA
jgi:hypothetical protein